MAETNATPVAALNAPWKIEGGFDSDTTVSIVDSEGFEVCEVAPFDGDWAVDDIAKARLIQAAPELLAAAKVAHATICALSKIHDPAWEIYHKNAPELKMLERAITSAEPDSGYAKLAEAAR